MSFTVNIPRVALRPPGRRTCRSASKAVRFPPASHPDQQQFLDYQRELLELPIAELEGRVHMLFAVLRASRHPYSVIAGDGFSDDDQAWLLERLPQATITVWPGGGHFPHLAHPRRFAEHLAATAAHADLRHTHQPERPSLTSAERSS